MSDINVIVNDEIVNIDIVDEPVLVNVVNSPGVPGAPGQGVPVGGTTGQVLAKNSATNYDTEWVNVSGGAWGGITGTLSNQTDLQSALDAKVPYTGATADVSLGEYGINVGNVIYDTTPTGIPTDQGATYWDDQSETVALVMNGTIQKIGEDTFYHVKNSTGSTIAKGVAVRFAGTDGASGKILIAPFLANGTYPSQYYMGITAEAITNGSNGKVYHFGKIRGVNTSAFADGDILYCSTTSAGGFQTTAPSAPNNIVIAAAVINAGNNGTLMVRTTTGSNINTDEGVLLTTPTSGQVLKYNGSLWVNDTISGALGYTPANAATTLTINGVSYDLSANRSWTVGGGISGSGASGQVAYWTGTSAQSGSNDLFWDNANGRLDITALIDNATGHRVGLNMTSAAITRMYFDSSATGSSWNAGISISASTVRKWTIAGYGSTFDFTFYNEGLSSPAIFVKGSTNNVILGGSTTDNGQKLQVQGTTLLNGNVTFSSSTGMTWDATNGNLGIGTTVAPASNGKGLSIYAIDFPRISMRNSFTTDTASAGMSFYMVNRNMFYDLQGANNHTWVSNATERMRIFGTGNILIQSGGTFSDTGERLQVTGTMKVTGNTLIEGNFRAAGAASATTANSVAMINLATATGLYSIAMGFQASSTTPHAIAIGYGATASANPSVAIGRSASATGVGSVAFSNATAQGTDSIAGGNGSLATGISSMAFGNGSYTYLTGQLAISTGKMSYNGDSQYSMVTGSLNTNAVSSGGTYSFPAIRPNNGTFSSGVTQIWLADIRVVFSVKGKNSSVTEFNLLDTYTAIYTVLVRSNNTPSTVIIGTPQLISTFSDTNMATTSISFTVVSNNLVVNVTPPTWVSAGQVIFRGTVSYNLTELGNYAQLF